MSYSVFVFQELLNHRLVLPRKIQLFRAKPVDDSAVLFPGQLIDIVLTILIKMFLCSGFVFSQKGLCLILPGDSYFKTLDKIQSMGKEFRIQALSSPLYSAFRHLLSFEKLLNLGIFFNVKATFTSKKYVFI
jgi:hypothetical protein